MEQHLSVHAMRSLVTHIDSVRRDTASVVNEAIATIKELIPDLATRAGSRKSRALLPFIGDLSHTLFGTATSKEVETLREHINTIVRQTNVISHSFSNHAGKMESYMTAVDERMTNIMSSVQANHRELNEVIYQTSKMMNMVQQIEKFSASALSTLIRQTRVAHQIEGKVQAMLQGVYQLMQGKLSSSLVSPRVIQNLIIHINSQLNTKFPGFKVLYNHPSRYYDHVKLAYALHNNSLFITITASSAMFQLFEALSFPVALNHTTG